MPLPADIPRVRTPLRAAFGLGSVSDSIHGISFNLFCFFYYVQVIGVPSLMVGLVSAIAIMIDAISDPLVGMLSDRLRTRLGRRHFLMLLSAVPLGFCFAALFAPPVDFFTSASGEQNNIGLAGYMLFFAATTRLALTFFSVPHLALGTELDPERLGRTRTMSWHAVFLWVGGAGCHFFGLTFFFAKNETHDNGMLDVSNYPIYGLFWGAVITLAVLASTLLTLHRVPYLRTPDYPEHLGVGGLFKDFGEVFSNRNYVWLLLGLILYACTAGTHDALLSHMAIYYFEFSADQFRFYGIAALGGYSIGFLATATLHKKANKVTVLAGAVLINAIASSLPIWLRMLGLLPDNDNPMLLPAIMTILLGYYGCQSILIISVMSLLGDIADEHELNSGKRREGVFYAARSFFGKASSAIGHMLAGVLLNIIQFPSGSEVLPGTVDEEIVFNMGASYGIIATIPGLLAAVVYMKCKMTTRRHEEVMRQLDQRAGLKTSQT